MAQRRLADHRYRGPAEAAARKLLELANAYEPVQDDRIFIEKINGPFLFELKGTPAEYRAGRQRAIEEGWWGQGVKQVNERIVSIATVSGGCGRSADARRRVSV